MRSAVICASVMRPRIHAGDDLGTRRDAGAARRSSVAGNEAAGGGAHDAERAIRSGTDLRGRPECGVIVAALRDQLGLIARTGDRSRRDHRHRERRATGAALSAAAARRAVMRVLIIALLGRRERERWRVAARRAGPAATAGRDDRCRDATRSDRWRACGPERGVRVSRRRQANGRGGSRAATPWGIRRHHERAAVRPAADRPSSRGQSRSASERRCDAARATAATAAGGRVPQTLEERQRVQASRQNFEFVRVERLAGNIGYVELRGFMPPAVAGRHGCGRDDVCRQQPTR